MEQQTETKCELGFYTQQSIPIRDIIRPPSLKGTSLNPNPKYGLGSKLFGAIGAHWACYWGLGAPLTLINPFMKQPGNQHQSV